MVNYLYFILQFDVMLIGRLEAIIPWPGVFRLLEK